MKQFLMIATIVGALLSMATGVFADGAQVDRQRTPPTGAGTTGTGSVTVSTPASTSTQAQGTVTTGSASGPATVSGSVTTSNPSNN